MDETGDGDGGWARRGGTPAPGAPQVPGVVMQRLLGIGGQGEVWLARDLASGDDVAVKVRRDPGSALAPAPRAPRTGGRHAVTGGAPAPSDDADRLAREVAVLRRINHPHVVRLRRVVDLPGGARALVMDHAAGGSLSAVVADRGPLAPAQAAAVVVPLARTVAELHARGLVHGDLTASNVLFAEDGRPLIADLGCAVVLGEPATEAWASPGYADPAATGPAGPADDVYGLGAVLRFALTGDPISGPADGSAPDSRRPPDPRRPADPATDTLLALADLCTVADASRRPEPRAIARTILASVSPDPVREPRPDPVPTAATGLPITAALLPGASPPREPDASGDDDPRRRATRRRPVARARPAAAPAATVRPAQPTSSGRWRLWAGGTLIGVIVVVLAWFGGIPARGGSPSASGTSPPAGSAAAAGDPAPGKGESGASESGDTESVEAALVRLSHRRAEAFATASIGPLTEVDEPGSPALAADVALVERLRAAGLRLAELSFDVTEVRLAGRRGNVTEVRASVTTSAHRQLPVSGAGGGTVVVRSAPSLVAITLVLAPDRWHWLVRETSAPPPQPASTGVR